MNHALCGGCRISVFMEMRLHYSSNVELAPSGRFAWVTVRLVIIWFRRAAVRPQRQCVVECYGLVRRCRHPGHGSFMFLFSLGYLFSGDIFSWDLSPR